jgi:hypothetical protein
MTAFIVHFDAERSLGLLPAPIVNFPMGFPLVIAQIWAVRGGPEAAASLISTLLYGACMYSARMTSIVRYAGARSCRSPAFVGD